jgi:hypothetical protein
VTKTRITWNGKKVTLAGYGVKKYHMFQLGNAAVKSILRRTEQGLGNDDSPMPPLKPAYARWKQRIGLKPIRDLRGPGKAQKQDRKTKQWKAVGWGKGTMHMLHGFRVTFASERRVQIDVSTGIGRLRARANETAIRKLGGSGWWGFSGKDAETIMRVGTRVLGFMVHELRARFAGNRQTIPIWMDPLGQQFDKSGAIDVGPAGPGLSKIA